jgi:hypothetical protein
MGGVARSGSRIVDGQFWKSCIMQGENRPIKSTLYVPSRAVQYGEGISFGKLGRYNKMVGGQWSEMWLVLHDEIVLERRNTRCNLSKAASGLFMFFTSH